jgi:hypothetical protein
MALPVSRHFVSSSVTKTQTHKHTLDVPPCLHLQAEELLLWLLRRGQQLHATQQLGPQALGATAAALARLRNAQRRTAAAATAREAAEAAEARERAAAAEQQRRALLQQLADAAIAQRSRLTPQVRHTPLCRFIRGCCSVQV